MVVVKTAYVSVVTIIKLMMIIVIPMTMMRRNDREEITEMIQESQLYNVREAARLTIIHLTHINDP